MMHLLGRALSRNGMEFPNQNSLQEKPLALTALHPVHWKPHHQSVSQIHNPKNLINFNVDTLVLTKSYEL